MNLRNAVTKPKTLVVLDPTSQDGEGAIGLLTDDDTHISLVVLVNSPSSTALHLFADSERLDPTHAASIYLDQVATRLANEQHVVEVVVNTGSETAAELIDLLASDVTCRVLLPASLERLEPGVEQTLAARGIGFEVAPGTSATSAPRIDRRSAGPSSLPRRRRNRSVDPLTQSPLALHVPEHELRKLRRIGTEVGVSKDTRVVKQGTPGHQCLVIVDGIFAVERNGATLARLGAGEVAGEMALLTGKRCNADVVAASDGSVLVMNRREFDQMLAMAPALARHVVATAMQRMTSVT